MTATTFEQKYFGGEVLYGDNFGPEEIAAWFADEENGYADLVGVEADQPRGEYGYGALNQLHGFSHLPPGVNYGHVLGFGSNFGDELKPILASCDRITLLDSSKKFQVDAIAGVSVDYLLAQSSGNITLADQSVDLITCFGVLHHIPNVSKVLSEFHRVLKPGGFALIREPITTMGDWRKARRGLTARERGLPRAWFLEAIQTSGLRVNCAADCYFPPWIKVLNKCALPTFGHPLVVSVDAVLARLFRFNYRYHRGGVWSRFGPASLFVVAQRLS